MVTRVARRLRAVRGAIRGGLLVTGGVAVTTVVVIIGVLGGGGSPPPPPGSANLWIDSNGGTCTRQASAGTYVDAQACGSAQAAESAASCGDRVRYVAGTYAGAQSITTGGKACSSSTYITFSPPNDTANAYGSPSSVVLSGGISINGLACWCAWQDFDSYADTSVTSALVAQTAGGLDVEPNGGTTPHSSVFVKFIRDDMQSAYLAASDIQQTNGSIGGFDACPIGDQDAEKIWSSSTTQMPNNVTVDGTIFHDIHHTCNLSHIDCMQVGGGSGDIFRNLVMYQCPDQALFVRPAFEAVSNLTVNNVQVSNFTSDDTFGQGSNAIYICKPGPGGTGDDGLCSGVNIVNNSVNDGSITNGSGGNQFANNYSIGGYTFTGNGGGSDPATIVNNAYTTGPGPGGTGVHQCTPTFANSTTHADLHLSGSDTCLKDNGNATIFATPDIDGDTRPQGTAPDIGADEYVAPAQAVSLTGGQQMVFPAMDQSSSAFTWMIDYKVTAGSDGQDLPLLEGDSSGGAEAWSITRAGTDGPSPLTGVVHNVIDLYRRTTNDDHVWTDPLTQVAADGEVVLFLSKINGGGTCSPTNQGDASCPQLSIFVNTGGRTWVHKTGSPTPLIYQLANGNSTTGGTLKIGGTGSNEVVYQVAGWLRQLSQAEENQIASSATDGGVLAKTPDMFVSAKTGLATDESGHGRNRTSSTGVTTTASTGWNYGG